MTHRNLRSLALVGATLLGLGTTAAHAQAATATGTAKALILRPITVTKTADLDYARIVTGVAASTVTVSPAGALTCGTGLTCLGTVSAAAFSVVGTVGQVATVSVPATVTLNNGASSMTSTLVRSAATLTLAATNSFTVGGVLAVGASQPDGPYSGNFTVTVDYQ